MHDADGVLDTAGGETQAGSWVALRPSGTLVSNVQTPEADKAAAHGPAACSSSSNRTAPDWRRSPLRSTMAASKRSSNSRSAAGDAHRVRDPADAASAGKVVLGVREDRETLRVLFHRDIRK
ncbi:hypothetical protein [Streptomyces sp. NBC_00728]|uniref:hypothetical protein n=1 Tax=Streptomyces sp. NBC_00728 TaxID=2903676 RepID=UPI00386B5A4A